MNPESPNEEQDREVIEFCLALLRKDPEMNYREARKEARAQKGLAVRRQLWSAARREAGVTGRDDDDSYDQGGDAEGSDERSDRGHRSDGNRQQDRGSRAEGQRPGSRSEGTRPGSRSEGNRYQERPGSHHDGDARESERPSRPAPWQADPKRPVPPWAKPRDEERRDEPGRVVPPERRASGTPPSLFSNPAQNAIEFMVRYLQAKPEAPFEAVREAAEDAGFTVYPATFGRAQAIVGIIEANPRPIITTHLPKEPAAPSPAPAAPTGGRTFVNPEPLPRSVSHQVEVSPEVAFQIFFKAFQQRRSQRVLVRERVAAMLSVIDEALEGDR
ncbi:MAG TPA: hypothetical protein PKA37_02890 [Planctomycetota bacterium]|nr:hypothetical protein [Planctomycetota bacterium]